MYDNGKEKADTSLSTVFEFGNNKLRTITDNGEPWFAVPDACRLLGHTNPRVAIKLLDEDERSKKSLPRQGETWFCNESGLYNLIFRSNRPEAKGFRKWVTSEVLPAIRQKRLYGQITTLGTLKRKVTTVQFNGTNIYNYRDVQRQLGYNTKSSLSNVRYRYAGQVVILGGKAYVSEAYVKLMVQRATARFMAIEVQQELPLVAPEFNALLSDIAKIKDRQLRLDITQKLGL